MNRRLVAVIVLVLLAGFLLAGCTTTARGERRLNLSPLLFYSEQPEGDQSQLELLGPLFSWERAGGATLTTLAPFFYYLTQGDNLEAEFLYPFGHYKTGGGHSRFNLIPLSSFRQDHLPEGASSWQFFPFYGGRTSRGEGYGGVFPFYGTYKERFGRDRGHFFLWPLYSSSVTGDTHRYGILWPFFYYAAGREQSFAFWPLGGRMITPGKAEKYYALWPLIHSQRLGLDTDKPRTVKAFLPFYAQETTPGSTKTSVLFPFFTHYHQDKGNYTQWDTPWPFIVRGDGDNFRLRNYFPFYYSRQEPDQSRLAFFWWLFDQRTQSGDDSWEQSTRYLFLSSYVVEIDSAGAWKERHRLWPLAYSASAPGWSHFHAPEILFMQSPGFDRLFGPYVYLWSQNRRDTFRQGKAFWGLYRWQADVDYRLWELSFLASGERSAAGSSFRLLSGLVTWERQGPHRHLKLFYLPKGFSW